MRTSAAEFRAASTGTELPLEALIRLVMAPLVCAASLALCMLAYGEAYSWRYPILATVAFLVVARVFGEMPLGSSNSVLIPYRTLHADWVTVIGVLLLLGFVTKF